MIRDGNENNHEREININVEANCACHYIKSPNPSHPEGILWKQLQEKKLHDKKLNKQQVKPEGPEGIKPPTFKFIETRSNSRAPQTLLA